MNVSVRVQKRKRKTLSLPQGPVSSQKLRRFNSRQTVSGRIARLCKHDPPDDQTATTVTGQCLATQFSWEGGRRRRRRRRKRRAEERGAFGPAGSLLTQGRSTGEATKKGKVRAASVGVSQNTSN